MERNEQIKIPKGKMFKFVPAIRNNISDFSYGNRTKLNSTSSVSVGIVITPAIDDIKILTHKFQEEKLTKHTASQ